MSDPRVTPTFEEQRERLLTITSALAAAVTPTEVFEAVVDHVCSALAASTAALWLLDETGRTAHLVRSVGYPDPRVAAFQTLALDADARSPAIDVLCRGEPVWIASQAALLHAYPHLASSVTAGRSYRVSCLPLGSDGRTLGVLGLTIEEARETSDAERGFLLLVARYASQALERLRLLEAERRSRAEADAAAARMSVLNQASRVFGQVGFDHAQRLDDIVRELGTILGSSVAIRILHADGCLHSVAVYHPVAEAEDLLRTLAAKAPIQVGEGITGEVARTGISALVPNSADIAKRIAPAYHAFFARYPTYAMMAAALRTRGRIIGTVAATRTRAGETYSAADLEMLEALADRAASAIENSRLHHESIEAARRAEQLYRFVHAVVSAQRLEQVFEAGLDAIEGALGTNRAAILLFDEAGVMRFRASRNLSAAYRAAVEGHSPWPRDAAAPQPVLVPDVAADATLEALLPVLRAEQIGSVAFIPLVTRGALLGKFMVYYREPHGYSTSELELASAIANNLASVTARFAALAALEQTLHYNELFAGVLAHDLRNPLAAIMTASQMLLMRREGAATRGDRDAKPASQILASGQRMLRMIDQLLDVTRARVGGGIDIDPRDANLADVCSHAIRELELVYPDRTIQCDVIGDQGGLWDSDRLLQIISNLLANASQHGAAGDITIRLDGRERESVAVTIHNAGTIPEPLRTTLFDPFRGARYRRDHARGLGLGLFIVKELVRAHGGTIDVTTSDAAGTTFSIRLPRRLAR